MPRVTRDHIALALVCLGLGGFGAAGTILAKELADKQEESVSKSTLVETCKKYNNPLREGLRESNEKELDRVENPDPRLVEQFGLTVQEAKELSEDRIGELKYNINVRFKEVPCEGTYDK
jgi:hypothetical protein